jgi:hypothetical protein
MHAKLRRKNSSHRQPKGGNDAVEKWKENSKTWLVIPEVQDHARPMAEKNPG